jgi:hypothetical protein
MTTRLWGIVAVQGGEGNAYSPTHRDNDGHVAVVIAVEVPVVVDGINPNTVQWHITIASSKGLAG